jgi:two-component system cell cycle sensor histidine kinase/response regulator CckA
MTPEKILVVEDEAIIARDIQAVLRSAGYEVPAISATGEDALLRAGEMRPDLVLMDIMLQGPMDGIEAAGKIRTRYDIPVAYLTAYGDKRIVARAQATEPVAYVLKPFEDRSLLAGVETALNHQKATRNRISVAERSEEAVRASERRYRKLVDSTTSYIYTVMVENGRPVKTLHEQGCVFVTGYTTEEFTANPSLWYQMVCEEHREDVIRQANSILAGKPVKPLEHKIILKDGTTRWVRNTSVPHFDEQGRLISYDGLITNISEERKLKDQLQQAQKMEAVGQLAAGIAHDYNNILTAIIGYGTILNMKLAEKNVVRPEVGQILDAADRAAKLTERLLTFSRNQPHKPTPMKTSDAVSRAVKLLSRIIGEDIQVKYTQSDNGAIILADSWQLEQVLMNLATNARDAMPNGGTLAIETSLVALDAEFIRSRGFGEVGTYSCISIHDSGTGMDEATLKRIFEPFFTTKDVGKGTGLGLSIVYGIVKQHRGFIDVASTVGNGASFSVYLPVAVDGAGVAAQCEPVAFRRGKETVLLAEDDEFVRTSTKELLERHGYKVIAAKEGDDALRKFREHKKEVNLLILDVVMPKKTGLDVHHEISREAAGIKTIFLSGYTDDLLRQKGFAVHEKNFVHKPISPAVLSQKIRDVMDAA